MPFSLELALIPSISTNKTLLMEIACFLFPVFMVLLLVQFYMGSLVIATVPNITIDQSALLALKAQISYDPHNILTKKMVHQHLCL
jgi:hypothetical protein